jgi:hypothetical protein
MLASIEVSLSMSSLSFEYFAQRYKPRDAGAQQLLLFAAPAEDIRTWAGVPRKAFDYQHGFQRTLNPGRVSEVAEFFMEDTRNISPTSVVIGFTGLVSVEPVQGLTASSAIELVKIRINLPDLTALSVEELTDKALEAVKQRISPASVADIEADTEAAVAEAIKLEDEEAIDEAFGINEDNGAENDAALESQERSYLADFYAQLLGYKHRLIPWPDEEQLREILYSLLKPAIIVDGQHRVFGAATVEGRMLLAVSAIPNSSWEENVYQFVLINQKAKPIKPAFLSSIIATSLSTDEIAAVYDRLKASNVDVTRAQIMDRANTDPKSPFRGMIDFEVEGSPGFLQFPGMARLERDDSKFEHILHGRSSWRIQLTGQ